MAEVCLGYLLSFDRPSSVTPEVFDEFLLAGYAAQHWVKHAKLAENGGNVIPLIMELFECETQAYSNWTCLYNPNKPWQDVSQKRARGEANVPPPPLYMACL